MLSSAASRGSGHRIPAMLRDDPTTGRSITAVSAGWLPWSHDRERVVADAPRVGT
jgi:hypothetical protein